MSVHDVPVVTAAKRLPSSGKCGGFTGSNVRPAPAGAATALLHLLAVVPAKAQLVDRIA